MGYRDSWINNKGAAVAHYEDTVQALDKYNPDSPVRMLCRGDAAHIWAEVLPEGSVIDNSPSSDKYDVILDSVNPAEWWAWLLTGGLMFIENPDPESVNTLVQDICTDIDSWLPTEEIMSIRVFPHVLIVEKRNPRVMEYLNVYTGEGDHDSLQAQGVKRLTVQSKDG